MQRLLKSAKQVTRLTGRVRIYDDHSMIFLIQLDLNVVYFWHIYVQEYKSIYCSNILILPISILVFHLAAISILENWWQYIADILIEQYIANFEQYIAHFMVDEKIFSRRFFQIFFIFRVRLTENVKFESMSLQLTTLEIIKTIQIHI